ncbi:MAG: ATP-binding protein [Nitrospira sp.]|nr:ATP-binding protein [Nitrospira sp.]
MLISVLDNAVKFTHSGKIVVTVAPTQDGEAGMVHFAVADRGIAICPDKVDTVFEAFTQLDSSNTRQYGGIGLGLSLVNRLVELMGGRVWIVSLVGQGSTASFTAYLPVSDTLAAVSDSLSQTITLRAEPRRILIVDDSEDNRDVVKLFLKGAPLVLAEVENGALAVEKVKAGLYDLVLTDMQMPVMDG